MSLRAQNVAAAAASILLFALGAAPLASMAAASATLPPPQVVALVDAGRFAEAEAVIAHQIAIRALSTDGLRALEFERERMRRIRLDFPLDAAAMEAQLRAEVPDLTASERRAWDRPTLLESLVIDGEKRYFARAVPNLFRVSAEARSRRRKDAPRGSDGPMETLNDHHREVLARGAVARRVRVTQSLIVAADAVPDGETVRAWIPYPREIAGQQDGIALAASVPATHRIAPPSTLQRTVYLEQPARAGKATTFSITYALTVHGRHHPIVPENVVPAVASPELAPFLAEQPPHIVFTAALRAFSEQVVGDETDPYRIAQALFAAVDAIPWGSAREYSTISNISDYALHQGHADCGQQTLLLIALLRLNGIPARWQSGMVFSDGDYDNLHDWGALHLAPVGWVPMDVTTGALDADDPALRSFYLGSLDAYRIAFNDDISTPFVPPKRHVRSETVDSQRGEVEWDGGNLYFDQWDYRFEATVLRSEGAAK